MDLNHGAERLKAGVQKATILDRYDRKVSDPKTSQRYAQGMKNFLGHDVPETVQAYVDSIPIMTTRWDVNPTNAMKWVQAMERVR